MVAHLDGTGSQVAVWSAPATSAVTGMTVTSSPTSATAAVDQHLAVDSFSGVSTVRALAVGDGAGTMAQISAHTAQADSLVFAVGEATSDKGAAVEPGRDQSPLGTWADSAAGASLWAQQLDSPVAKAGSAVTVGDALSAGGSWALVAVELPATHPGGVTDQSTAPALLRSQLLTARKVPATKQTPAVSDVLGTAIQPEIASPASCTDQYPYVGVSPFAAPGVQGYRQVQAIGGVWSWNAPFAGSIPGLAVPDNCVTDIVGMARPVPVVGARSRS